MLWEFSIVSSLSWYSILVQYVCNDRAWLTSECSPRKVRWSQSSRAPILPPYTISLGPLYHKILSPPLLKYKLGLAKMKPASKKTQKLLICEMSSNTANKMRGAQTLWNINHFIGGYNLFRTRGTYLLNEGKKTPFRKIVILEKLLLCEMSSSTVKWEEVPRLFEKFIILLVDTICFRRKGHIC